MLSCGGIYRYLTEKMSPNAKFLRNFVKNFLVSGYFVVFMQHFRHLNVFTNVINESDDDDVIASSMNSTHEILVSEV